MSEPEEVGEEPKKKSKLPMILGVALALVGAAGGFYATWSGAILSGESEETSSEKSANEVTSKVAFVAMDPLVISLRAPSQSQHLRFRAQLEVPAKFKQDVELLLPRIIDVMNSYLRALDMAALEDASALLRLRAQMLRRVQIVTGQGRVNDLLIMEFVFN